MNIAVYTHYFTPEIGAPSARIYDMAQQWLRAGHTVQVITCFPNHPTGTLYPGYTSQRYRYEQRDGVDVHRHWTFITPNTGLVKKTLGHVSYLPASILFSNPHLTRPDIVIASSPTFFAAMAGIWTAHRCKAPFIMEIRDLWPAIFVELGVLKNRLAIRLLEKLELWLYSQATNIVTVTEAFRHDLIQRHIAPDKISTIRNGADIEFWIPTDSSNEFRQELGISNETFVALYIGAHGISHALERLVESAEILEEHSLIQFLFVGEGARKSMVIQKVRELHLNNVKFFDPVDKAGVKKFYALADVCFVPLRNIPLFDTFIPSKMFEMLAMGKPVIGSVRGEAADILRESQGAIVAEPENSQAIAEAVLSLSQNAARRQQMGERGRQFVIDYYSRHALALKYIEVMQTAISKYGRNR